MAETAQILFSITGLLIIFNNIGYFLSSLLHVLTTILQRTSIDTAGFHRFLSLSGALLHVNLNGVPACCCIQSYSPSARSSTMVRSKMHGTNIGAWLRPIQTLAQTQAFKSRRTVVQAIAIIGVIGFEYTPNIFGVLPLLMQRTLYCT